MKKTLLSVFFFLLTISTISFGQIVSAQSGAWNVGTTWIGGSVPGTGSNVIIASGDTVTVPSGTMNCLNLTVNSGGVLTADGDNLVSGNLRYIRCYGDSIINNGIMGTGTDGLSIDNRIPTIKTIVGTDIKFAKIRAGGVTASATVTIAGDVTLSYQGAAFQFQNGIGQNITTLNINTGASLTTIEGADLTTASSVSTNVTDFAPTINIDGTVLVGGIITLRSLFGTPSIVVNSTGTLTVNENIRLTTTTYTNPGIISGDGSFTLGPNGKIEIAMADGLDPTTGQIRTAVRTFPSSAGYTYVGTEAQVTGSDLPSSVYQLTINNPVGVTLNAPVTVTDTATIATGASLVETNTNYVTGLIKTTQTVDTSSSTLGGIGVYLNSGADSLGTVTVIRTSGTAPSSSLFTAINRSWDIISDNPPAAGRDVTFNWASGDDNSVNLTKAIVFKSTDSGSNWLEASDVNGIDVSGVHQITAPGVTSFSLWTVGRVIEPPTVFFEENFNYPLGQLTSAGGGANVSDSNWTNFGGTGYLIQVSSEGLNYPGYQVAGADSGKITLVTNTSSAEDVLRTFPNQTETVYGSMLINVVDTTRLWPNSSTNGDYFAGFLPSTSTSNYVGRFSIKRSTNDSTFLLGIRAVSSSATTWASGEYSIGTTYLIVFSYEFIPGGTNDIASVWINPVLDGTEPPADAVSVAAGTEPADISRLFFRQAYTSGVNGGSTPQVDIDKVMAANYWNLVAAVTPVISVTPDTLTGFTYVEGAGPSSSQSYTLNGVDLNPADGDITVAGSGDYEVSTDNLTFSGSVDIAYTGSSLTDTTIYVRLISGLSSGTYDGETILNSGGGASTQEVIVNGTVVTQTVFFEENFNYPLGQLTSAGGGANVSDSNWTNFGGTGYLIQVSSESLNYPGYQVAGADSGKITLVTNTSSAEDIQRIFPSQTGIVFASMLINVLDTTRLWPNSSANGDYLTGFLPPTGTSYSSRFCIKRSTNDSTFLLGIRAVSSSATTWASGEYSIGTTYLIAFSYEFIPGDSNDVASLWINPDLSGIAPTADAIATATAGGEPSDFTRLFFRQAYTSGVNGGSTPHVDIDKVMVANYWNLESVSTSVENENTKVTQFELAQNYPNPFNPTTKIRFSIPQAGNVKLTVFNILGQEVQTIVNSEMTAGTHTVDFGSTYLSSGIYIYKIQSGSFTETKKMTLIK